jgi:UDP-N-acetylglucosamine diphosphorylase/glucosamine-1-phosphate N-acetyltransferase
MTQLRFFSDSNSDLIYPLNIGRSASTLHFGARSVSTQWKEALEYKVRTLISLNSRLFPTQKAIEVVTNMKAGDRWESEGILLAEAEGTGGTSVGKGIHAPLASSPTDYYEHCGVGIAEDLSRMKRAWSTRTLSEEEREGWAHVGVFFQGELDRVHVAPGAKIRSCTINTENGDVMLGLDSEIMEGSNIRGPFVLGAFSKLKMGSQIYGPTTIGAHCKIGGELNNVVIHDYTNKAHGGFIGNSVLGSWCNLGAGTVSSNLKNTYGEVEVWSKSERSMVTSGSIFCGLLMADHSKTAINTSFNTGTVVGAFCNIFEKPAKHIASFSWGGSENCGAYEIEKAISTARIVMGRRDLPLGDSDTDKIRMLFKETEVDRVNV